MTMASQLDGRFVPSYIFHQQRGSACNRGWRGLIERSCMKRMTVMHRKTPWVAGRQRRIYWIILVAAAAALAGIANPAQADEVFPHWEFLGPPSAPLDALAVAPSDPEIVYGSYLGNFFGSADGGAHWQLLHAGQAYERRGPIAVDPVDPLRLLWGETLRRSADGGRTWLPGPAGLNEVAQLIYSPADQCALFASTGKQSHRTCAWHSGDGGISWREICFPAEAGRIRRMAVDPADSQRAYFATDSGLYRTSDGARSIHLLALDGRELTAVAASAGSLPALYAAEDLDLPQVEDEVLIHVSHDGGASWEAYPANFGMRSMTVIVHDLRTGDPGTGKLYAAVKARSWTLQDRGQVAVSEDGGATWRALAAGLPDRPVLELIGTAADETRLWCRPERLGPYSLELGRPAQVWQARHQGLFSANVFTFAVDPEEPGRIYVPLADVFMLARTVDGGDSWEYVDLAWPMPVHRKLLIHPRERHRLLGCGGFVGISRSTDWGVSWEYALAVDAYVGMLSCSPLQPDRVVAVPKWLPGATALLSDDFGENWRVISTPFDGQNGFDVAVAPSDPQRVYAGIAGETNDSYRLLRSDDGGQSWRAMQERLPEFQQIIVDPQDADTVYWHADGGSSLRRSADGGQTYTTIQGIRRGALPGSSFGYGKPVILASDPLLMYATAPYPARSLDGGRTWQLLPGNLPELPQFGRGSYLNDIILQDQPHPLITIAETGLFRATDNIAPRILAAGSYLTMIGSRNLLCFGAWCEDRNGREDISQVLLRFDGSGIELPLLDDGNHGDAMAGDGYFAMSFALPSGSDVVNIPYRIGITDSLGFAGNDWPILRVPHQPIQEDDQ